MSSPIEARDTYKEWHLLCGIQPAALASEPSGCHHSQCYPIHPSLCAARCPGSPRASGGLLFRRLSHRPPDHAASSHNFLPRQQRNVSTRVPFAISTIASRPSEACLSWRIACSENGRWTFQCAADSFPARDDTGVLPPSPTPPDPTCSNGLEGYDGLSNDGVDVCCSSTCGECTQRRCRRRGSSGDCCPNVIAREDRVMVFCDDSQSAPCILGGESPNTTR